MAWEDEVDPDWVHELPFWLVAAMAHGALLTLDPVIRWGSARRADEKIVPIEFVAQLPTVTPNLAPAPGDGATAAPRHGKGAYEPPKLQQGARDAPPKARPVPKPAAANGPKVKPGSTVKAPAAKAVAPPADPVVEARRRESARIQAAAAARARERRAEEARAEAEQARLLREHRAEQARAEARELARQRAEAAAARAQAARLAAERRAAIEAERRRVLAERRAAKAARRAELSSALATMEEPDEALDAGAAAANALAGLGDEGAAGAGGAGEASGPGPGLSGAARAAAAAALAESPDPGDVAGSGGAELIDAPARGGGEGPEGGGVSWSMDGSLGSRRVLQRTLPTSPDWVGTRGLDLTVTVRFQVLPDGRVRPGAVQKTSGFPEIDRRALEALRGWRFEAAPGAAGEVWGRVTFRFTS